MAPDPVSLEMAATKDINAESVSDPSFINEIISSTPELAQFQGFLEARYNNVQSVCSFKTRDSSLLRLLVQMQII